MRGSRSRSESVAPDARTVERPLHLEGPHRQRNYKCFGAVPPWEAATNNKRAVADSRSLSPMSCFARAKRECSYTPKCACATIATREVIIIRSNNDKKLIIDYNVPSTPRQGAARFARIKI